MKAAVRLHGADRLRPHFFELAFFVRGAAALRGRRHWATRPPAPPARDFVPWIPDSMLAYAKRQARMLMGRLEQAAAGVHYWHTKGMRRCAHRAASIKCRGFGGALRPRQGARGAAPARMNARKTSSSTEREGQRPLA